MRNQWLAIRASRMRMEKIAGDVLPPFVEELKQHGMAIGQLQNHFDANPAASTNPPEWHQGLNQEILNHLDAIGNDRDATGNTHLLMAYAKDDPEAYHHHVNRLTRMMPNLRLLHLMHAMSDPVEDDGLVEQQMLEDHLAALRASRGMMDKKANDFENSMQYYEDTQKQLETARHEKTMRTGTKLVGIGAGALGGGALAAKMMRGAARENIPYGILAGATTGVIAGGKTMNALDHKIHKNTYNHRSDAIMETNDAESDLRGLAQRDPKGYDEARKTHPSVPNSRDASREFRG